MTSNSSGISYSFDVQKNNFTGAGEASSTIKKLLMKIGIDSATIRKAAIAAYEAEMNIVIHSSSGGTLKVDITPSFIRITAEDSGPGIEDVDLAMQEGYSTAPDWIRELGFGAGMGLSNIKRCSDSFSIETQKRLYTKVSIILNI